MKDEEDTLAPADLAGDEDMTAEQLWDEIDSEDEGTPEDDLDDAASDGFEDDDSSEDQDDHPEGNDAETPDLQALQEQNERLTQQLDSEKGRARGQQKRADRLQEKLDKLSKSRTQTAEERQERERKLADATEQYGDVVGPLADEIKDLSGRLDTLSELEQQDLEEAQTELDELVREEHERFMAEHPDGLAAIQRNQDAFREWIQDQPKMIRDAFETNRSKLIDGTAAALVVSRFKAALLEADGGSEPRTENRLQNRRQRQLAGARDSRTGGRQSASSEPLTGAGTPEDDWNYFERLDAKKRR
jgi:chromosome segregation ATPase